MSTNTFDAVLRQVELLPPAQQRQLVRIIEERQEQSTKPPLDKRVPCEPMKDRTRELVWIEQHRHEYAGQWVALDGDRLIAASPIRAEISVAIKADGAELPLIDRIPSPDEPPFMGI